MRKISIGLVINTEQHIVLPFSEGEVLEEVDPWIQCQEASAVHPCGVEWCVAWCRVEWAFGKEKFIQYKEILFNVVQT